MSNGRKQAAVGDPAPWTVPTWDGERYQFYYGFSDPVTHAMIARFATIEEALESRKEPPECGAVR